MSTTRITTSSSTRTIPTRIGGRSRPGWRQTAVRFRAEVTTMVFPASAARAISDCAPGTGEPLEQLTLFDTTPYLKGVK